MEKPRYYPRPFSTEARSAHRLFSLKAPKTLTTIEKQRRDRVFQIMTIWSVMGAIGVLLLTNTGPAIGEKFIADVGLVQRTTLCVLLISAITAAVLAVRHPANRLNLALLACGFTIYAGREHDLHRLDYLPEHFTRWQFYTMSEVSLWQKLGFGAVMIFIISVIGLFLFRMALPALRDLKRSEPWALLATAWAVTLTASQISDRTWLNETFAGRAFEEVCELVAAGMALMVVCYFPRTTEDLAAPAAESSESLRSSAPKASVNAA